MKFIQKHLWLILGLFLTTILCAGYVGSATFTKGKVGKADLHLWDGSSTRTFTRLTSEGYSLTLRDFDYAVDVHQVFGGGVLANDTVLASAKTAIGTSNKVALWLAPVEWSITNDITMTDNLFIFVAPGATFNRAAGKTLTIQGGLSAEKHTIYTGTGTTSYSGNKIIAWTFPEHFGAAGDGATDDEDAINFALATGFNVKLTSRVGYYITDALVMSAATGQTLAGIGQQRTRIKVDSSFDITEDGIIELGTVSQTVRDLFVVCEQPDTATKGNLTIYPDVIYANALHHTKLYNLRFDTAYDGIDLTGDTYDSVVQNVEMSVFNYGIQIDGNQGHIDMVNLSFNDESMTTNNKTILDEATTYGLYITRCDSFSLVNGYFQTGTGIKFNSGGAADVTGSIVNTLFHDIDGIVMAAGEHVTVEGSTFKVDDTDEQAIEITGGNMSVIGGRFDINADLSDPAIDISGTSKFYMSGATIDTAAHDMQSFYLAGAFGAGQARLIGNHFIKTINTAYSDVTVKVVGSAILTFIGNDINPGGTSTGDFVAVDDDNVHTIINNYCSGFDIDLPASPENINVHSNTVLAASAIDQQTIVGPIRYKFFTWTLDANGDEGATAHNITNGQDVVIGVWGFYESGATAIGIPDCSVTIAATTYAIVGHDCAGAEIAGMDNANYRITVVYTNTTGQTW